MGLLHFLEVYVGDVVVGVAALGLTCAGIRTGLSALLGLSLCVEDVLLDCAEEGFDFFDCGIDGSEVACLLCVFEA